MTNDRFNACVQELLDNEMEIAIYCNTRFRDPDEYISVKLEKETSNTKIAINETGANIIDVFEAAYDRFINLTQEGDATLVPKQLEHVTIVENSDSEDTN